MCKSWNSNGMGRSSIISPLQSHPSPRFHRETEIQLSDIDLKFEMKMSKWKDSKKKTKSKICFSCEALNVVSSSSSIFGTFICCQNVKRKTGRKSIEVLSGLIQFELNIVENQFNCRNSFSIFDQIRIHWNLLFNLWPKNDMNEMKFQCWPTTTISEKVSEIDQLNNQKPMKRWRQAEIDRWTIENIIRTKIMISLFDFILSIWTDDSWILD